MRLTQLKLAGFKSFVEPTIISTPSHLVGVVGPNGCGKSNIIDAVRWVMGESRASELRGESMQDVIFNGSVNRKPAARASVELVFDNSSGRAAGQWSTYSEISVRRTLTRDGASTYYINNQPVRRRDVHDIFLGTGLGARGYAIIGQGMINRLIEAKPEELRVYLEEAAGVSRYKERRRETENRLRDTRDNLTRVEDILRELDSQLERLEAQAQVAREYRDFQRQGVEKQHLLWLVRENQARQDQQDRFLAIEQAQTELEKLQASLRAEEAALESRRQALYEAGDAVHAAQGRLFEAGAQVSRIEAELRHINDARDKLQQRHKELQQQVEQWQQQQAHCAEQLAEAESELEVAEARREELSMQLDDARDQLPDLETQVRQASLEREQLRTELARLEQALALAVQSRRDGERQIQALQLRRERVENQLLELPMPDADAVQQLEGSLNALNAQLEAARSQVLQLEGQLPALDEARRRQHGVLQQAQQDVERHQARLDALVALQTDIEQKSALQPWLEKHGLQASTRLWQMVQIERGWENALEAALLERTGALKIDDLTDAAALAGNAPPARLAFFQLPALPDARQPTPDGMQPLLERMRIQSAELRALLADWLHGVYVCPDMDSAMAARAHLPAGHQYVTKEGHLVGRYSIRYYAPDSEASGMLARQQEIENVGRDLQARKLIAETEVQALESAEQALKQVSDALAPARTRMAELVERVHQQQLELTRQRQQLEQAGEQAQRLRDDLDEIAAQHEEMLAVQEELQQRIAELEEELAAQQQGYEEACDAGEHVFERAESRRQGVRELEARVQEADYAERSLKARIAELSRTLQLAADQAGRASSELSSVQGDLFNLEASTLNDELQAALEERAEFEHMLERARIEHDNLNASLRADDERRLTIERSLDPLRTRITDLQLKEQAARLAIEQFSEQLDAADADRKALQARLDQLPEEQRKPGWLQSEVQRLSRRLDSLGAVNLAALDELEAARERRTFLAEQYDDLVLAIETLEDAIRKIDRETRALLQTTFDRVNQHFGELFPQLFGGGEARLTMTGDEILDAGVLVMAQPPGKRNSTIHLLSGGEKALTAIALVFALFKLNPAPFCLLDEVDAPLDDANTERYAKLVSAMSEQTQFLFISHNKIAMQMAKLLVGVTMQEQGVSRIVAVDMESALEMAQA